MLLFFITAYRQKMNEYKKYISSLIQINYKKANIQLSFCVKCTTALHWNQNLNGIGILSYVDGFTSSYWVCCWCLVCEWNVQEALYAQPFVHNPGHAHQQYGKDRTAQYCRMWIIRKACGEFGFFNLLFYVEVCETWHDTKRYRGFIILNIWTTTKL